MISQQVLSQSTLLIIRCAFHPSPNTLDTLRPSLVELKSKPFTAHIWKSRILLMSITPHLYIWILIFWQSVTWKRQVVTIPSLPSLKYNNGKWGRETTVEVLIQRREKETHRSCWFQNKTKTVQIYENWRPSSWILMNTSWTNCWQIKFNNPEKGWHRMTKLVFLVIQSWFNTGCPIWLYC